MASQASVTALNGVAVQWTCLYYSYIGQPLSLSMAGIFNKFSLSDWVDLSRWSSTACWVINNELERPVSYVRHGRLRQFCLASVLLIVILAGSKLNKETNFQIKQ